VATRVAVIGAGSWGTAVAALLTRNAEVVLWARRPELAASISSSHRNLDYHPDVELPAPLSATSSLEEAAEGAEVVVLAVPSHGFRQILGALAPHLGGLVPVVSLAKGLEQGTLLRMTEVVAEVAPGRPAGVLTGPNLASEVMAGQPTASVVAFSDRECSEKLQGLFSTESFRVYTNPDVVGCEIAGALKNVIAIAAGIADGMGFGDNTRAALITRGLAELGRLGTALGGDPLTFGGLAGMGDLVATCSSAKSRNHHVGVELGRGRSLGDIVSEMNMVAEGVKTSSAALELGSRHQVEMPIAEQVVAVLHQGKRAADIIPALMSRRARPELHGIA
jgi:glycerol-3-phosphate dehydrogenase (NAD(P)+)